MKIRIIQEQWFWRWVFKVFKRSRKPTAEKSTTENPRRKRPIFVMENIFCRKVGIQSTDEMAFKRTVTLREFSIFPPSDLMRPRYCRSADARMRMQNALLLCKPIVNLKQWEWGIPTDGSWILSKISFRPRLYLREGEHRFLFFLQNLHIVILCWTHSRPQCLQVWECARDPLVISSLHA